MVMNWTPLLLYVCDYARRNPLRIPTAQSVQCMACVVTAHTTRCCDTHLAILRVDPQLRLAARPTAAAVRLLLRVTLFLVATPVPVAVSVGTTNASRRICKVYTAHHSARFPTPARIGDVPLACHCNPGVK
jgi:hypothetical protein